MRRNRLFLSICQSFTLSKIIPLVSGTMKKCGLWWKASRIRALRSLPLSGPREDGGYEIVSGHRRQKASELAGYFEMPCIVRNLTDEEAITQMVEDNTNQRESILPSERAKALKMQLEAIKRQGARADLSTSGQDGSKLENGQRSNAIVAERNKMTVKQVQRYIKLNDLVPDLMKMVDEKKIAFTPAVEMSYIKPKNQRYIAVAIEGQQSAPSLSQAQRMRELDQKKDSERRCDRRYHARRKKGGRQSDYFQSGTQPIFREGKDPPRNEGCHHQTAGRVEGKNSRSLPNRKSRPNRKNKRGASPSPEARRI